MLAVRAAALALALLRCLCAGANSTELVQKAACLADYSESRQNCLPVAFCARVLHTQGWRVCLDDIYRRGVENCLVYSIGIADEWGFDRDMGALGCEVHSFDPTVSLPRDLAPNVTFHKIGLYGGGANSSLATKFKHGKYGKIDGEMYHIADLMEKLGHKKRMISVFKIDCEGCEWEVFGSMGEDLEGAAGNARTMLDRINQVLVEFHFSANAGAIVSYDRMGLIGKTYDALFENKYNYATKQTDVRDIRYGSNFPFARFYVNNNAGGEGRHAAYFEGLINDTSVGFPTHSCCREMGLVRVSPGGNGVLKAETIIKERGIVEGALLRGYDSRTVYLFSGGTKRPFSTGKVFLSMGFSFDNVTAIPSFEIGFLPEGAALT